MKKLILPIISILKKGKANKQLWLIFVLFFMAGFCPAVMAQEAKDKDLNMHSPFGVLEFLHWNHPWNDYKYPDERALEKAAALMAEAGISWVRMDFLWQDIEPQEGKFEFEKYDTIVNLLARHNINVLGLLDYSADWASPRKKWNYPPRDNKFFVDYAVKVIERYKDKVKYWEVWNEPDSRVYWAKQDGLKRYCGLLKDVYVAAKKAVPGCKILNGGFAAGISSINRLYRNGAKDYFDIMNIHIFESPLNPTALKRIASYPKSVYAAMARNGDGNKKIWVTEIGCPGVKVGDRVYNWWMGKNPSEGLQAKWVTGALAELLKDKNVEKIFWAFFRDCKKHWGNGIDYLGLVRWDFSRKPGFFAYQEHSNKRNQPASKF